MGRAEWLLKQHQKLIDCGFLPVEVAVQSEDEKLFIGHVDCIICKHPDLLGIIIWQNKAGETQYTGLTCFERVVDRLNLVDAEKRTLRWVARHRKQFEGKGGVKLDQAEITRLLSYKRPLSSAYGGRWKLAAEDIWASRDRFPMSDFERGVVETLVYQRRKYWTPRSPTPRQRRFLNQILIRLLRWRVGSESQLSRSIMASLRSLYSGNRTYP